MNFVSNGALEMGIHYATWVFIILYFDPLRTLSCSFDSLPPKRCTSNPLFFPVGYFICSLWCLWKSVSYTHWLAPGFVPFQLLSMAAGLQWRQCQQFKSLRHCCSPYKVCTHAHFYDGVLTYVGIYTSNCVFFRFTRRRLANVGLFMLAIFIVIRGCKLKRTMIMQSFQFIDHLYYAIYPSII